MMKRFLQSEAGAARSSIIFAAFMGVTAFAMLAGFAKLDANDSAALNELSGTQYLSSQKLQ